MTSCTRGLVVPFHLTTGAVPMVSRKLSATTIDRDMLRELLEVLSSVSAAFVCAEFGASTRGSRFCWFMRQLPASVTPYQMINYIILLEFRESAFYNIILFLGIFGGSSFPVVASSFLGLRSPGLYCPMISLYSTGLFCNLPVSLGCNAVLPPLLFGPVLPVPTFFYLSWYRTFIKCMPDVSLFASVADMTGILFPSICAAYIPNSNLHFLPANLFVQDVSQQPHFSRTTHTAGQYTPMYVGLPTHVRP